MNYPNYPYNKIQVITKTTRKRTIKNNLKITRKQPYKTKKTTVKQLKNPKNNTKTTKK